MSGNKTYVKWAKESVGKRVTMVAAGVTKGETNYSRQRIRKKWVDEKVKKGKVTKMTDCKKSDKVKVKKKTKK